MSWPDELQRWAINLLRDPYVLRPLMRLSGHADRVEDALQDALLAAPRIYARPRAEKLTYEYFRSLMCWRARGRLIDEFHDLHRVELLGEAEIATLASREDEQSRGRAEAVQEVLAELPEDEQRLARLRLEGYTFEEIAAMEGGGPGNIHRRLQRALQPVRQRLWELYAELLQGTMGAT